MCSARPGRHARHQKVNRKAAEGVDDGVERVGGCFLLPLHALSGNSICRLLTATVFSYFGLLEDPEDPSRTIDPDGVWLGLCLDDDLAKTMCVAFLKAYVKDS